MKPEISLIIVNYNTSDLLRKCIQAVRRATRGVGYEIIVIDNGSTDGSIETISSFQFPVSSFQLVKNQKNLGFARAVNQGARKAQGEYILLLNPDTTVGSGTIKKLVDFAKNTIDAGVVGPRLVDLADKVQPSVYHFPTLWGAFAEYFLGQANAFSKYAPVGVSPSKVDALVGAAFLITPTALKKVGLLDEHYFLYFEDLDYCRRVKNAGLSVYYLPSARITHEHGAAGRDIPEQTKKWLVQSSKLYHGIVKYYLLTLVLWLGQKWRKFLGRA